MTRMIDHIIDKTNVWAKRLIRALRKKISATMTLRMVIMMDVVRMGMLVTTSLR